MDEIDDRLKSLLSAEQRYCTQLPSLELVRMGAGINQRMYSLVSSLPVNNVREAGTRLVSRASAIADTFYARTTCDDHTHMPVIFLNLALKLDERAYVCEKTLYRSYAKSAIGNLTDVDELRVQEMVTRLNQMELAICKAVDWALHSPGLHEFVDELIARHWKKGGWSMYDKDSSGDWVTKETCKNVSVVCNYICKQMLQDANWSSDTALPRKSELAVGVFAVARRMAQLEPAWTLALETQICGKGANKISSAGVHAAMHYVNRVVLARACDALEELHRETPESKRQTLEDMVCNLTKPFVFA